MNNELFRALEKLIEIGKLTEEEALYTFIKEMIEDFAPLIDALHNVACVKQHACDPMHLTRREERVCYYELENQINECWELPDHLEWTETFYAIVKECGHENIQDVINALGAINANTQLLIASSPKAAAIAHQIVAAIYASPSGHLGTKCPVGVE